MNTVKRVCGLDCHPIWGGHGNGDSNGQGKSLRRSYTNESPEQTAANKAFANAIAKGIFDRDESVSRPYFYNFGDDMTTFVGEWMYMGANNFGDVFKNKTTRRYIQVR